ncbi:hypothetical protein SDC9_198279 [bioreactor metagenome]|uniref:Uncharacterized protein n=1 Tax=bioreactor metagenome TaxID=1076179 RepID=A0A645IH82_9ZZZZ
MVHADGFVAGVAGEFLRHVVDDDHTALLVGREDGVADGQEGRFKQIFFLF